MQIKQFITRHIYSLCLILIVFIIALRNYQSGTWLTGWDNLHPEFDFGLNFNRSFFAVWQEYQGLGLLGGMAHASDLVHQLFLWIVSFVIPLRFLRYFYHFLMLLIGVLGVYTLLKDIVLEKTNFFRREAAALGGLFYLLNFGTIQYFYVPFEPFSTFWGLLPWEIFILFRYLRSSTKKNLIFLAVINLIATPQAYVQTLFLVYIICIGIISILYLLKNKTIASFRQCCKVGLLILFLNSFWLLPNLYFVITNVKTNENAMQNYITTDKFFLMNKKHGTIFDFITLKEFYYDFVDVNKDSSNYYYMMNQWIHQLSKIDVQIIQLGLFGVLLLGMFLKTRVRKEFTLLFILSMIFSLSDTPIISQINNLFRNIPLINQIFRNPFTKIIVPTLLTFSVFFGCGTVLVADVLAKKDKRIPYVFFILIVVCIFYAYFPVLNGQLFNQNMKVEIPKSYFDLFKYLSQDGHDKGRIANFPQAHIWGWGDYSWGSRGSGFIWYGIKQPILDRAFDVWSDKNENYYWEVTRALYVSDLSQLENVLEKYQIRWLLLDQSIFSYVPYRSLYLNKLENLIQQSSKIHLAKQFERIRLYEVNLDTNSKDFVFLAKDLPVVGPGYKWGNFDKAYEEYGNYITDNKEQITKNKEQITDNKKQRSTRGFGGFFGSFSQSWVSNDSNSQGQDSQSKIEKSKIVDVKTHNFILNNNKLITQKVSATATPHTNITELNLSSAKGMTIVANATWPISAQISDNRLNWDLVNINIINNNNNMDINSLSKDIGFNQVFAAEVSNSSIVGVSSGMLVPDIYYPFRSLFTGRKQGELEFGVETHTDYFSFKTTIPKELVGYKLEVPELEPKEVTELDDNDLSKKAVKTPQVFLDEELINTSSFWGAGATPESDSGQARMTGGVMDLPYIKEGNLEVRVPKINGYYSYTLNPKSENRNPKTCDNFNKGIYKHDLVTEGTDELLRLTSVGSSNCLDFDLPNLSQDIGYLVTVENRNIEGKSLLFSVINKTSQRADIETYLPKNKEQRTNNNKLNTSYFIIPPMEQYGLGYTLHLDNISIGRVKTVNDLGKITVNPIPYRFLTSLKIIKDNFNPSSFAKASADKQPISVDHPNPSLYQVILDSSTIGRVHSATPEVSLPQSSITTLVLSQSFDEGWKAYSFNNQHLTFNKLLLQLFPFFFGKEIKDHVMVNNWENGWRLQPTTNNPQPTTIILVYLPQYLEYLGFILLGVGILVVFFYPSSRSNPMPSSST